MSSLKKIAYFLTFSFLAHVSFAQSSVWKVTKGGQEMYLGGTIHLLKKSDYPLPKEFDQAYGLSQKLVFETDIESAMSPSFQGKLMQAMMLPPGQSLKNMLSNEAYMALEEYAKSRGKTLDLYAMFKPQMIGLVLSIEEYQRLGFTAEGVDVLYAGKAKQDGKSVGELETVEEQLAFISTAGKGNESELILQTIKDMEKLPSVIDAILSAWKTGDMKQMHELGILPMLKDYPSVYKSLLVERNNNWMPQIEAMLKTKEVEFVLVGALHLAGNDGLLEQLKNKGYTVSLLK